MMSTYMLTETNLETVFYSSITTSGIDEIPLVRRRAHATGVAGKGRTTALGLALVVLEHEQIVRAQLEGRVVTTHRLIGVIVAPRAHIIARAQAYLVKGTNGLVVVSIAASVV